MNTCPKCGAQFQSTVKICPNDGTVLEEAARSDPRIGTTLDGKYRLESALGQGGMGTIYRATHLMLDKPVALKLIKGDLVTSPEVVRRFQREARAASNLNHPNIAAAYDLGQTSDGTLYIAMELVNGPSLKDVIRSTGPLPPARIGRILRQVAGALSVAHKHGIIHRDLKPHNIMLATQPGGGEVAKLLDFGIAKTFDDSATQLTATGFVLGTPQYMSPEQAAGRPIDGRSDLYSLGIIMFEMLVGDVPFNDPSTPAVLVKHLTEPPPHPSRRRPDLTISPALEAVALRCLEKDPAARFQNADEFIVALDGALGLTGTATAIDEAAAKTIIVSPPSAPTGTAPVVAAGSAGTSDATATSPLAATVVVPPAPAGPTQKTAQVFSPVVPPAVIPPTAPAPAAIPPTAPSPVAAPPAAAPAAAQAAAPRAAAPPPPLSAAPSALSAASSSQSSSSPLGRNVIVVGAVLVLLIAVGAYAAYATGWFRGRSVEPAASSALNAANTNQPPATPPAAAPAVPESQPGAPSLPPAGAGAGTEAASSAGGTGRVGGGTGRTTTSPRASGSSKPAAESTTPQAPVAPVQPVNPSVAFRCSGPGPVCASLRSAMGPALDGQSIVSVSDPAKADILIEARVTLVDERTEQMFGTTFVTRTYSVELSGETRQSSQAVPMPSATTFSYDARVGQEKLDGQTRLIAASAAEKVRSFWKPKA